MKTKKSTNLKAFTFTPSPPNLKLKIAYNMGTILNSLELLVSFHFGMLRFGSNCTILNCNLLCHHAILPGGSEPTSSWSIYQVETIFRSLRRVEQTQRWPLSILHKIPYDSVIYEYKRVQSILYYTFDYMYD